MLRSQCRVHRSASPHRAQGLFLLYLQTLSLRELWAVYLSTPYYRPSHILLGLTSHYLIHLPGLPQALLGVGDFLDELGASRFPTGLVRHAHGGVSREASGKLSSEACRELLPVASHASAKGQHSCPCPS